MSTTVTYKGNTITTVNNETRTLLTQDKWVEDDIVITDESRGGGVDTETDPVFSASPAANITQTNINNWNNKSNFSGNYNDLTNKPVLDTSLSTVSTRAVENQAISIALEGKASKQYVDTAISNIPSPMIFKGSLGTNGTITSLPNASATNTGFTYKVIQAGIYASQTAEIGDIFISDGTNWILIPSGDDISNVIVTPVQTSGTKIATITIDTSSTDLYAPTPVAPPNASTLAPNMDGTAAAGTSTSYARADHIHPVDTSRASANDVSSLTTRVGNLETAIGTGGSVDNKIATAIQGLDSSITATSGEAISAITITDGKITTSSKITIPTYTIATTATDGLMSSADKLKLNNCSTGSATALQYIADGTCQSVLLGDVVNNIASGMYSIAEGNKTTASANNSHTEGDSTYITNSATASHAEGHATIVSHSCAHAEGDKSIASGEQAHAQGHATTASGKMSHAEGDRTQASGYYAHAEGFSSRASQRGAHAEGSGIASGQNSHAEGVGRASGLDSHAEGRETQASGWASHAEGLYTIANHKSQHVFGEYNIADASTVAGDERGTYIEIVGNGYEQNYSTIRRNARTLDWSGNEVLAGKLTIGADPTSPMEVATKQYVDNHSGGGGASYQNIADGTNDSVILGAINTNVASGQYSVAEGEGTLASNWAAHAEGSNTVASGYYSHAEGYMTKATTYAAHAEGQATTASGSWSHAEGYMTKTSNDCSHAEGNNTKAIGFNSHAEGGATQASGQGAHTEGDHTTASGNYAHAEGENTSASGSRSHAEGNYTAASEPYSHAEGSYTTASGEASHAEGSSTITEGQSSHAEGDATTASGNYAHTEGYETTASGEGAHSEGARTLASTAYSHAEGAGTTASGPWSHAEGNDTIASSYSSHVEGCNSTASGSYSHAEGYGTLVSAQQAHAEGYQTRATGINAHAGGYKTTAAGGESYTFGRQTYASQAQQTVIGRYNKITTVDGQSKATDAAFVIGNGTSAAPSDAFAVKWDGTLVFANGTEITPAQFAQLLTLNNKEIIIDISRFRTGEKIDKTWQEIYNLVNTGNIVIFYRKTQSSSPVIVDAIYYNIVSTVSHIDARTQEGEDEYIVQCIQNGQGITPLTFTADSADDYIKIKA